MQSFLHNLINDHAMDHENVWIVEDNARSPRYSDPSRLVSSEVKSPLNSPLKSASKTSNLTNADAKDIGSSLIVDESDQEQDTDSSKRFQFLVRGPQRSDSAVPSGTSRTSRWTTPLRRSMEQHFPNRNWTESHDSSLCCPVRRVSHESSSLEALRDSVQFSSGEFTSGEFTSGEFSVEMDTIMEDPFGSSCQ